MKTFSTFCAIPVLSAGFLAAPAMAASCRDNTTLDTGLGAVGGGPLGAGATHRSAGGLIGGALTGGLIGNAIGRDKCKDRHAAALRRNRDRNSQNRNQNNALPESGLRSA